MVIISSLILQQKGIYMYKKSLLSLIFISALLFQGCSKEEKQAQDANADINAMVSKNEYVLTSTDNKQLIIKKETAGFVLEGAEGKVLLLDIFATWCPPCKAAAAHLSSLQEKYKDDLVVIGVTIEEDITNIKLEEFKKDNSASYTIVNSDANRRLVNEVATSLELGNRFPIPIFALYKDGKLINHYVGAIEEELIESDIKRAVGK